MAEKNKLSEEAQEKNGEWKPLVEHCYDLFTASEKSEYRKVKIQEIEDSRKTYEQISDVKTFPWKDCSNIVLPLTTITIDNLEPRLVAGLVGKRPFVQFAMKGYKQPDDNTEIIEDWYNYELEHYVKIENVARRITHDLLLEGTTYDMPKYEVRDLIRRDFQFDEEGNIKIDPDTEEPLTDDYIDPLFEGAEVEKIPFSDIFVADTADNWEEADKIRVVRPTYAELMRLEGKPGYMNIGPWLLKDQGSTDLTDDEQTPSQKIADVKVNGKKTIECLECHVSYFHTPEEVTEEDQTRFEEEKLVALIAKDSKILIRLVLLRDLNFRNESLIKRHRLYPEAGRAYGTPIYGKLKSIQNGASDIFNLVVNIATVCMIPWFLYSDKTGIEGDVEIHPGKGVKCDNPQDVVFPKFQIQPQQFIEFITMFTNLWEKISSIGDLQIGRTPEQRKETATAVMSAIQEGNIKHNYQSAVSKDDFISLLKTIYDLYYMKMPFEKMHLFKGEEKPLPRQAMRRDYKFKLTGSTEVANKLIERRESEDLYQLLSTSPHSNPIQGLKDLLDSYGKTDTDKYINPEVNQLLKALEEFPQLMPAIQETIQQVMEAAQALEAGGEQRLAA